MNQVPEERDEFPDDSSLQPQRGVRSIEVDDELMQDIQDLVETRATPILLNILTDLHPADIADIINRLEEPEAQAFVFTLIQIEPGSEVLHELEPSSRRNILELLPSEKISQYLTLLPSDEATDVVAELSPVVAQDVLETMPTEESQDVRELMQYPEDTAGGIMDTDFVSVTTRETVSQAISKVRAQSKEGIQVYTVYVVDEAGVLVGSLPLQSLVLHSPHRKAHKVMESETRSIRTDVDQEEVAAMFRKYDLVSLPVVNGDGKLVGRITIDDVIDVIEEEHREDVARMVGSDAEELEHRSPRQIAMLRLPWVLVTLIMEFGAGVVVHLFDATLSRVILLASFMPIISAISGNTGLQSAAIVVRAMATGHISIDRWWNPIWRQLQTTLIIGTVCGLVIGLVAALWHGKWEFGTVVGISMFISINLSGVVGTSSPMISKSFGFDPALTAGPFETAFQDVVGITIFLSLATLLLHWIA